MSRRITDNNAALADTNPLVSVIIPVYNVENYIQRCIESILSQTYPDIELVIIDDGTPDNSIGIAEKLLGDRKNTRIIHHGHNKGLTAARENGLRHANGKYVMFVDPDDHLLDINGIEAGVRAAEKNNADMVVYRFQRDYGKAGADKSHVSDCLENPRLYFRKVIHHRMDHNLCFKLYNASLFSNSGITFNHGIGMGEDLAVFPKLVYHAERIIDLTNINLYNYNCNNPDSFTAKGLTPTALNSLIMAIDSTVEFVKTTCYAEDVDIVVSLNRLLLLEYTDPRLWKDLSGLWPDSPWNLKGARWQHRMFFILYRIGLHSTAHSLVLLKRKLRRIKLFRLLKA
ncbi:MAG: glycosyltransferase family 2 protein [Muribaculaceae bacterium]|nr:glycosyltransferase family 2 protein [Muribaculaceae bacterium]